MRDETWLLMGLDPSVKFQVLALIEWDVRRLVEFRTRRKEHALWRGGKMYKDVVFVAFLMDCSAI
jgi:hypothetical protein